MNTTITSEIELNYSNGTFSVGGVALRPELVGALALDASNLTEEEVETGIVLWEVEFDVDFTATPDRPGYTSGRYEDCYPDEPGEVEIQKVKVAGVTLTDAEEALLLGNVDDELARCADERAAEASYDYDDSGYDDSRYDY